MDAADRPERDHGGMRCAARLLLSAARSRHQVHPVLPSDHRVRPGRTPGAACLQPEPECLCGALGQVGEGGVPVQGDPLWRALAAASAERICRTFPCRTESPREGQCPAVSSECKHPPRRACSMPRATGRPVALLPSGGSVAGAQQMSAQTETKTMRIKDVRQGLHTLLHTQGLDELLHLYKRLDKGGRALLLCLLCAEAGLLILVNAWLRLERAYLKLRLFLRV